MFVVRRPTTHKGVDQANKGGVAIRVKSCTCMRKTRTQDEMWPILAIFEFIHFSF